MDRSALAMALVLAVTNQTSLAVPRDMTSLSSTERASLPDSTPIVSNGHTLTLGFLRHAHLALLSRFGVVQSAPAGGLAPPPAAIAMSCSPPDVARQKIVNGSAILVCQRPGLIPPDEQSFCASVTATLCDYLPATQDVDAEVSSSGVVITDWMLTDHATCNADGGIVSDDGAACSFKYFLDQTFQFAAEKMPGVKLTSNCQVSGIREHTDPYGSGSVAIITNAVVPSTTGAGCTVTASAPAPLK